MQHDALDAHIPAIGIMPVYEDSPELFLHVETIQSVQLGTQMRNDLS